MITLVQQVEAQIEGSKLSDDIDDITMEISRLEKEFPDAVHGSRLMAMFTRLENMILADEVEED
ncbi:hypothetical protein DS843_25200 [Roseomonas genomospecies 6]|uniref:Uncharacterized protein n=1 Tax=Roseomonas genomospecies 6 TaxID=214106 RepID=A0A9W7KPU2_9PROT|nr:hypothetical protein DS843_25200 [Roseomonas genomospecies 6]